MATSCRIGRIVPNPNLPGEMYEQYQSIRCHWDGYPEHVGNILVNHYNTDAMLSLLLELGDISCLAPTIKDTIAYHRDLGEPMKKNAMVESHSPQGIARRDGCRYVYYFKNGKWAMEVVSYDR